MSVTWQTYKWNTAKHSNIIFEFEYINISIYVKWYINISSIIIQNWELWHIYLIIINDLADLLYKSSLYDSKWLFLKHLPLLYFYSFDRIKIIRNQTWFSWAWELPRKLPHNTNHQQRNATFSKFTIQALHYQYNLPIN